MNTPIEKQIFIGGCERSGTTLLGAMLGENSRCICTPESPFKIAVLAAHPEFKESPEAHVVLQEIKNNWRFKIWNFNINFNSTFIPKSVISYADILAWLVKKYAEHIGKDNVNTWVDHTPDNIRWTATLFGLYPTAKLVHIVRDGRAVAASVLPLDWGPNTLIKAAHFWLESVAYGFAIESCWGTDRIKRIKYEELISNPETTLKNLCSDLGIEYQSNMVNANGFKVPKYTSIQHPLVGKKPDQSRTTAWERILTPRQIEIFESLTHEFLYYLGYPLKYGLSAKAPCRMEKLRAEIYEIYRTRIVNRRSFKNRKKLIPRPGLNNS